MSLCAFAIGAAAIADARSVPVVPKRVPPKRTVVVYRDLPMAPEAR